MKKLPHIQKTTISPTQREFLERWLALRSFDQAWGEDAECRQSEGEEGVSGPLSNHESEESFQARSYDTQVQLGDVRLLPPHLLAEELAVPRYVAVLSDWDGDVLICPFAPYSVPAVTGELATGREHFSLAVLQLWNAVIAPETVLRDTWYADSLSDRECADANAAFRSVFFGADMPGELINRVGAPIWHPEDPRIAYQTEETEVFARLRAACLAAIEAAPLVIVIDFEKFVKSFENFKEKPAAADSGKEFTPCVVHPMHAEQKDIDETASGVQHWAEVVSFEDIVPGKDVETSCRWEVTSSKKEPVGALVYVAGEALPIANAAVNVLDNSLEILLYETDLPTGHPPVRETEQLRLVVLVED